MEKLEVWRYWCSGGVVQWRCLIICMIVVWWFQLCSSLPVDGAYFSEVFGSAHSNSDRQTTSVGPMDRSAALPDDCPVCCGVNSIRNDPWHFLSCESLRRGEITVRHDDVGRALYRTALTMGLKAQLEPRGLDASSRLRPDFLLSLPGRLILSDVAVCHPLAPGMLRNGQGTRTLGRAKHMESEKRRKYAKLSSQRQYELLPFVVETYGGLAPSAVKLIQAMAQAAAQHLSLWSRTAILRELVGSVAIAVQRGSAMSYLEGYDKSLYVMSQQDLVEVDVGAESARAA